MVITNSIMWGNKAPKYPSILMGDVNVPSTLSIEYSDLEGGQGSVVYTQGCTLNWGSGMIDEDPLCKDIANGDYHLSWLSPCINRGTNVNAPNDDIDSDYRPFMGTVEMGADEFVDTHSLKSDTFSLSESTGGVVSLSLNGGTSNGGRDYLMLSSITGTAPGIPLPGGVAVLCLNWDIYTEVVSANLNTPYFLGFLGKLDSQGNSVAKIKLPPIPGFAGITIHSAYALAKPWNFASNPVAVEIVP